MTNHFRFLPFNTFCERVGLYDVDLRRREGSAITMAETFIYNADGLVIAKLIWNFKIHAASGDPQGMVALEPMEGSEAYSELWL